ncbi:MAG: carboxymuconolactone decarboxylase family protein [Burkholderiaceae bacterium]|nr:carboxymuconolactone decarboxylase family protein [Burkholderiaceae bacterium]
MSLIGSSELSQLGIALRTKILSNDRVDQALAHEDDLDEFYHLFGHECCYAQIWSRELLAPSTRSLVTVAMLAVQGPLSETLGVHIRGALRNGCSRATARKSVSLDGVDLVARGRELRLRLLGPQASEKTKVASGAHEWGSRSTSSPGVGISSPDRFCPHLTVTSSVPT